jgi:hypothetical protein
MSGQPNELIDWWNIICDIRITCCNHYICEDKVCKYFLNLDLFLHFCFLYMCIVICGYVIFFVDGVNVFVFELW